MIRFVPVALCACVVSSALAGDLTPPPGPVAPTLKTLIEVEPRTALTDENTPGDATSVFRITQSGSYYLTEDLIAPAGITGIRVLVDNVTIDLNGYTISGVRVAPLADGIDADNRDGVRIFNGRVRLFSGDGVVTEHEARLENLDVRQCVGVGIVTQSGCSILNNTSNNNSGNGISCNAVCRVVGNHCEGNSDATASGAGIRVGSSSRIDGNSCTNNDIGFDINGAGNIIVRNTATSNTPNYSIVAGNDVGTIQGSPVGAGAWDNFQH